MRHVALVALLASTAAAYPVKVAHVSAADKAKRAELLRKRTGIDWTTLDIDDRGYVAHLRTNDASVDIAKVKDILAANADLFGIAQAQIDQLSTSNRLVTHLVDNALTSEINVRFENHGVVAIDTFFTVDATPTVDAAAAAKRVVGQTYHATIGYAESPHLDCAMTPMGGKGCEMPIKQTVKKDVTLAAADLKSVAVLHDDGKSVRLLACVEVSHLPNSEPDPAWGKVGVHKISLVPTGKAPKMPLVVDEVTGDELDLAIDNCSAPAFANVR
jgi:hypothetical protein